MKLLVISETPSLVHELEQSDTPEIHDILYLDPRQDVLMVLEEEDIHVAVIALDLERYRDKAFALLERIKAFDALIDVVMLGGSLPDDDAAEWIGRGATDYFSEPCQIAELERALKEIAERRDLRKNTLKLEQKLERKYSFHGIIGKSPYMLETFSLIQNVAKHFTCALITGETGTGKELVARAVHHMSGTKNRKFVVCDCVSVPENLFESELFGYVRGAFTGADRDKKGLFEAADKGIIFLDEIGDIPCAVQAKLLRVLETRQFRPLGSNEPRSVDVRVLAATSKNLRECVKEGTFRDDLFHRLNRVEIYLHPLRERAGDICLLVRHFVDANSKGLSKDIKGISRETQKLFHEYHWPGNVRELENVLESASMLTKKDYIDIPDLPKYLQEYYETSDKIPFIEKEKLSTLEELEKDYIVHVMKLMGDNLRKTAQILDISRTTLYSKLKKYGIRR